MCRAAFSRLSEGLPSGRPLAGPRGLQPGYRLPPASVTHRRRLRRPIQAQHLQDLLVQAAAAPFVACIDARLERDARRAMEYQDAVADLHRLVDVMSDEDGGLVALLDQADELGTQVAGRHLVERGERLVAQQDVRLDGERPGDRDALAHAAGERVRIVVLVAGQPEPRQPAARQRLGFLAVGVEDFQAEQHVVERGAPRHQPIVLEHDPDLAAEEFELAERVVAGDARPGRWSARSARPAG